MKPVRAGKLRQRLTLRQPPETETFDTFGKPVKTYQTVGTYWGEIEPLGGREAPAAGQTKAVATHRLRVRYLGASVALNPTCQWIYNGRSFGVVEVLNVEQRNRLYEMTVTEVQGRTTKV